MIKVIDYRPNLTSETICTLFADTKEEVTGDLDIIGLPQGTQPAAGSVLITADGDIAFLKSTGDWNFVEDEPAAPASNDQAAVTSVSLARPEDLDISDIKEVGVINDNE